MFVSHIYLLEIISSLCFYSLSMVVGAGNKLTPQELVVDTSYSINIHQNTSKDTYLFRVGGIGKIPQKRKVEPFSASPGCVALTGTGQPLQRLVAAYSIPLPFVWHGPKLIKSFVEINGDISGAPGEIGRVLFLITSNVNLLLVNLFIFRFYRSNFF